MKSEIFISWSGEISKQVGIVLSTWLKSVFLGNVNIFLSVHDIDAGSRWNSEVTKHLENASFGILCITPDNLNSSWLLFEAGAISKLLDSSKVVPYLKDLKPVDILYPLAQFQGVEATKYGTLKLIESINSTLQEQVDVILLKKQFDLYWPDLEKSLLGITCANDSSLKLERIERTERDLLEEILALLRAQLTQQKDGNETSNSMNELLNMTGYNDYVNSTDYFNDKDLGLNAHQITNQIAPLFSDIPKQCLLMVVQSIYAGDKNYAMRRLRTDTGAKAKDAAALLGAITLAIKKYGKDYSEMVRHYAINKAEDNNWSKPQMYFIEDEVVSNVGIPRELVHSTLDSLRTHGKLKSLNWEGKMVWMATRYADAPQQK